MNTISRVPIQGGIYLLHMYLYTSNLFILVGLNTFMLILCCHWILPYSLLCLYRMLAKTSDTSEEEALRQFTTLPESVKYRLSTTHDMCM